MIITVGGDLGAGKSTVSKLLAQRLQYKHFSMGALFRKMADEKGITVEALVRLSREKPEINKEADDYQRKLGQKEDDFIFEGRLSWRFIPNSFKVFLRVDDRVGAQRTFADHQAGKRQVERSFKDVEDAMADMKARRENEVIQYKEQYGVDIHDPKNYDLVIDTTNRNPGQIVDDIIASMEKKKA